MICPNCNKEIPDGSAFCNHCGIGLEDFGQEEIKRQNHIVLGSLKEEPEKEISEKKNHGCLISLAICAGVFLIVILAIVAGSGSSHTSSGASAAATSLNSQSETFTEESRLTIEQYPGKNDDVIKSIICNQPRVLYIYHGSSQNNFTVWLKGSDGSQELLVNTIGAYSGTVLIPYADTYDIEVTAVGSWRIDLNSLGAANTTTFSGMNDYVTTKFYAETTDWSISNDGDSNFIVKLWSNDGYDLLVNEVGSYSGTVSSDTTGTAWFEIISNGKWAISPAK